MSAMFCFQCEQTAGGKGCTMSGVCGKKPEVANLQDKITAGLITLARSAMQKSGCTKENPCATAAAAPQDDGTSCPRLHALFMDALFFTVTNVNFDPADCEAMIARIERAIERYGGAERFEASQLFAGDVDVVSLRSTLLFGLRGMAAYAHHARVLGKTDPEVSGWFI